MANSAANAQQVQDALFESVSHGDVEKTKTILQPTSEVDINETVDSKGRNLLHLACEHGHINMVRWLVSLGADVKIVSYDRTVTLVSLAVQKNHTSIVSALVSEFGCDPNDGVSLHTACEHGNLRMVKTLIECGANVNGKDDFGEAPIHTACEKGDLNMVKTLIKHGADINDEDINVNTLLHLAAKHEKDLTTLALLGERTSNISTKNAQGETPLHIACANGNLGGELLLTTIGASKSDRSLDYHTPLSLAVLQEIAECLQQKSEI